MEPEYVFVTAVAYAPRFFFFGGQVVAEFDTPSSVPVSALDDGTLDRGDTFELGGRAAEYRGFFSRDGDDFLVFIDDATGGRLVVSQTASLDSSGYPSNSSQLPSLKTTPYALTPTVVEPEGPTNGDDILEGTGDGDAIQGLRGDDRIDGLGGDDSITGNQDNDTIDGGKGNDELIGAIGNDSLIGGKGSDTLNGNAGKDFLDGGDAGDVLFGGDQNDTLLGGNGNDGLNGGDGLDSLVDGTGSDTMTGGSGADVFDLVTDGKRDKIKDFQDGVDMIRLAGYQFSDLTISDLGNGTVRIAYGSEDLRLLEDAGPLDASDLTASDFLFS